MEMQPIYQDLPELYRSILPELFEELIPVEVNATCSNCAMCQKPGELTIPGVDYFKPDVKCCTYFPKLPNYLVGGLLSDSNPAMDEGRHRIRERIQNRVAITPQAVDIPKKYNFLHRAGGKDSFGRNSALLCPYYIKEGGLCSIWKFRDSTCSTYFCKTVAGNDGKKFWKFLRIYLNHVQDTLSWYVLHAMNWDTEFVWGYIQLCNNENLAPEDLDEIPPGEAVYKKIWGDWYGREEEFYRESYRMISALSREDVSRITGVSEKIFLKWLKDQHNNVVHPNIPQVLRKNPELKTYPTGDGSTYVVQTDIGSFTIQEALAEILGWFDGVKTTADIQKMVYEKYEDNLGDDLLLPMYFNRMLIPA